ncbi:MAG TPA: glycosyltransferase [Acidimicrobiales bacterium]|jgi:D-inositol-3-phosphate glycosyltransferase|nr:glycosyltransferase [Acidimicrobiales bacterium]
MARLAVLSLHTSPLTQPGAGDGGGMNVYVRELVAAIARRGGEVDVFTRREDAASRSVVEVEPGVRVHHVDAGPTRQLDKGLLVDVVPAFTLGVLERMTSTCDRYDAVHANYWLSGVAGHAIKHELDLPLLVTFHTAEAIKAATSGEPLSSRAAAEAAIVACADAVLASCEVEASQLTTVLGVPADRVALVPLGVDHAYFGPGDRTQARRALGIDADGPLLLFAGRLQALKGADLALATLTELVHRGGDHRLVVVGGPSGPDGAAFTASLRDRAEEPGVRGRVTFVAPRPHELLSTYYRAADACLVPSRAESFGLVALEASACGAPVVAADVGGLAALVDDGVTGRLVAGRRATSWADAVEWATEDPLRSMRLSTAAVLRAQRFTWRAAAQRFETIVKATRDSHLVSCD